MGGGTEERQLQKKSSGSRGTVSRLVGRWAACSLHKPLSILSALYIFHCAGRWMGCGGEREEGEGREGKGAEEIQGSQLMAVPCWLCHGTFCVCV